MLSVKTAQNNIYPSSLDSPSFLKITSSVFLNKTTHNLYFQSLLFNGMEEIVSDHMHIVKSSRWVGSHTWDKNEKDD